MPIDMRYQSDTDVILSHRHDLGWDFWTSEDRRLIKGSPFSCYNSAMMLLELGMDAGDPIMQSVADLFFDAWREDGRFKLYPTGAIYPCHTAIGAHALCMLGRARDPRVQKTLAHLLDTRYSDGGWRCNKFPFGRGPDTEYSNAMPTLTALNALRMTEHLNRDDRLDGAVEFLLNHWTIKRPIGPCQYGIGTRFMQVAYPFQDYNLFVYVYVLSFYDVAKCDRRFLEAFDALTSKLLDRQIVVERAVPKLASLSFCKKGAPSELATRRYQEILCNLQG